MPISPGSLSKAHLTSELNWAWISPVYQPWQAHDLETPRGLPRVRDSKPHIESLALQKEAQAITLMLSILRSPEMGSGLHSYRPEKPDFPRGPRTTYLMLN